MNGRDLLAELATDPGALESLPPESLPEALAEVEHLRARIWTRMVRPAPLPSPESAPQAPDRLLTVEEVADRLAVPTDWVYRRSDTLPFARKLADRTLRFSEQGLARWMEGRKP